MLSAISLAANAAALPQASQTSFTTYIYDEARAGYHNMSQLTTVSNEHATIYYDYNSHGQKVRERYVIDGQTYTRTFSYDVSDKLRARSFSDGETWPPAGAQYQYDTAGRLSGIPGAIEQIHYSPDSEIAQVDHTNGTQTKNTYDLQRKWLLGTKLSKGAQVLFEEQYTRDTVGRIAKIRSNRANGNWDYTYDGINRLTAATNVGNSLLSRTFTYSPSGNLTFKSDVGSYTYPAPTASRPHAATTAGGWSFDYDTNGNMVSGKGRAIQYDGQDRPVLVTMGGVTTQYVYGPDDKRLKKISGGQTTLYLGDDEEILPDGTTLKHLDGGVRRAGNKTNWIHRDHMSSVRMLTNASGTVAAISRYQPYGKRTDVQQAADTPRESKGWIGERDDPETALTYLNARYYDADLARFIQSDWFDPLDAGVGTNRYAYALNNPTSYKDPSGNAIETVWDAFNVSLGVVSFAGNAAVGNYWSAALDAAGVVFDGAATSVPGAPGGAGSAITIGRIATAANGVRQNAQKFGATFNSTKVSQLTTKISSKIEGNLDHLSTSDLIGAVGDILGNPVTINGKTYDHLDEVNNAVNGLKNQVKSIQKVLGRDDLTDAQRNAAVELLASTSNHIDRVEKTLDTARQVVKQVTELIE
ncbi:RHS repeat-associated core domain-containing protein [Pseudovibrio denitrificans]|uniref:RHS repeat-associated core domain-containing protein n=1 Tax=Pseudovibrio denitrificans TaxID=258256 RepID=A0A1I7DZA3_9HYPH|nr:RHS repeat-associated core domain-containing protein [Pseudovibrio denitrificans]SFU16963.1 RHS repeat-associated core domain-containing protein [Pseudovibrio denitrificans]